MTITLKPVPQAGMLAAGRAWPYMAGITAVALLVPVVMPQLITLSGAIALSLVASLLFAGVAFFEGMYTSDGIRAYWEYRFAVLSREIDELHQFSKNLRSSIEEFQVEHYPAIQQYGYSLPLYACSGKLFKRRYNQLWSMMTGLEYLASNFAGDTKLRDKFLDECSARYSFIGDLIKKTKWSDKDDILRTRERIATDLQKLCRAHHNLVGMAIGNVGFEISKMEGEREKITLLLREGN